METEQALKDLVRERYAQIAEQSKTQNMASCCGCGPSCDTTDGVIGIMSEDYSHLNGYETNADLGLGCGLPTQFAQIKQGDTVIDLGSGAGNDAFVARAHTGIEGKVIGIDFTEEMLNKARANAEKLGYNNVEFRYGDIEQMPVNDNVADVIVSNCVLNLVPNKAQVIKEIYRVLKPGGHFSISDIVLVGNLPDDLRRVAEMYSGCISGAIQKTDYLSLIEETGFQNIQLQKEKAINLPDEILAEYLTPEALAHFRESGLGILSVTVYAEKPTTDANLQFRLAQPTDFEAVKQLLTETNLHTEDLNPALANFLLAFADNQLVAVAGIDVAGSYGLLRSVAVLPAYRKYGIAQRLVNDLHKQARLLNLKALYLITTSADAYFAKQGFEVVNKEDVPTEIAQSQQFSQLCPSSAVVMKRSLEKPKIKLADLQQTAACCTPNSGCC